MSYPTIRKGMRDPVDGGDFVKSAQRRLRAHGFSAGFDGVFGPDTLAQVKAFQTNRRLKADGIVGRDTWGALLEQTYLEDKAEAANILLSLGFRVNTALRFKNALADFQGMYNFGSGLKRDGILGPLTLAALRYSKIQGGRISKNFTAREFACHCGGAYAACRRIWVHRSIVKAAEAVRTVQGAYTPHSVCRCVGRNRDVNGYYRSQHIHGLAMDLYPARLTPNQVIALRVVSAIGISRSSNKVVHVDNRHLSPDNFPKATGDTADPYRYYYA